MLAVHRRIIKTLEGQLPGLKAELVRETRHVIMDFTYGDKTYRATMAKSPKNPDHCVWNACKEISAGLGVAKVKI